MKVIIIGSLVLIKLGVPLDSQLWAGHGEENLNLEEGNVIKPILLLGELRHKS